MKFFDILFGRKALKDEIKLWKARAEEDAKDITFCKGRISELCQERAELKKEISKMEMEALREKFAPAPEQEPAGYIHPGNMRRLKNGETVAVRKNGWKNTPDQVPIYLRPVSSTKEEKAHNELYQTIAENYWANVKFMRTNGLQWGELVESFLAVEELRKAYNNLHSHLYSKPEMTLWEHKDARWKAEKALDAAIRKVIK